jgi:hypothetical protein
MSDWQIPADRRTATEAFCIYLHNPANAQDRKDCTITTSNVNNPASAYAKAKEIFAREGGFATIPSSVEFRVYESTDLMPRDNLVTIVLPRPDIPLPTGPSFDASIVWRCTWTPYRLSLLADAGDV